ncbi:hypothetical protein BBJ28_00001379 [Nothophytophthora sp. Chile5]|nr:hypothetical protein BBJ28_00001379 [Nothophytophthora sp. Chile5]
MATTEAQALALALEEGKTRDLYNALRASERFLAYREFQIALAKIARVKYSGSGNGISATTGRLGPADVAASPLQRRRQSSVELVCSLVNELVAERRHPSLDALRCQLARHSTLDTLERHLPQLVQSFQLYGTQNCITTNVAAAMQSVMTLDGFVDFLNAYFEYEEYFSYDELMRMAAQMLTAFKGDSPKAEAKGNERTSTSLGDELFFAQFLELFCRVASVFHNKLLIREGAQLRRAVEACRLEFSLEVLLDHMHIALIPDDGSLAKADSQAHRASTMSSSLEALAVDPNNSSISPRNDGTATLAAIVSDIRGLLQLDAEEQSTAKKPRLKRDPSMLALRQAAKKPSTAPIAAAAPSAADARSTYARQPPMQQSGRKPPPHVVMIREVVTPPPLQSSVLQLLESAMKFQNMAQYHVPLDSALLRYEEQRPPPNANEVVVVSAVDAVQTEVQLFFALQTASVYDSARRDTQALVKYHEALKLARQLPIAHQGRVLAKSCVGVTLFYAGELALARQCHQLVLDARKAAESRGGDSQQQLDKLAAAKAGSNPRFSLIDTATAMNNLACCMTQEDSEPPATPMEDAYLLFKHARQIYVDAFGPAHPRVEVLTRNLERVRACQCVVVSDATAALARGEYAHVIPGSTFQIRALEKVARLPSNGAKSSRGGAKKKKKSAK